MRIGEGIALPDPGVIHAMQEHVHGAKRPGLRVEFLAVEGCPATGHLLIRLEQQAAAAAGGVIDAIVFPRLHQRGHQLGNLAGCEEFSALLPGIGGKHGNHVLVGIADDIRRAQLAGAQVEGVKVFQQIAEGRILLPWFAKIHLRVEVDGAEYISQLSAVMVFNLSQRHVDLLTNLRIVAVFIEVIKRGMFVNGKAFAAHGALHAAHVAVILFDVLLTLFLGNIAQIFHEQHGENVILIAGTVDLSAEAVAGVPQDLLNIFSGGHVHFPFFALL